MKSWKVGERRPHAPRKRVLAETTQRHLEQLTKQARLLAGDDIHEQEDFSLASLKSRFANLQARHAQLQGKHLSKSDQLVKEKLQKEFEGAFSESNVFELDGEAWNEGVIDTLRGQLHNEENKIQDLPKLLYRVGGKTICRLNGGRMGIQYDILFAGRVVEIYHCVLESKPFPDKMHVSEHTIPFFLPLQEVEISYLASSVKKFIDYVGNFLRAFVSRREQVRLFRELKRNVIGQFYHNMPYSRIEFSLDEPNCKVMVSLTYENLYLALPTRVKVSAWPLVSTNVLHGGEGGRKKSSPPYSLPGAENALKVKYLHTIYEDITSDLDSTLGHILPSVAFTALPLSPLE